MFNTLFIFTFLFSFIGITLLFNYFNLPSIQIVIIECLVILNFILMVYISSLNNDPRLLVYSVIILFLSSVEVVYFILYFSKIL